MLSNQNQTSEETAAMVAISSGAPSPQFMNNVLPSEPPAPQVYGETTSTEPQSDDVHTASEANATNIADATVGDGNPDEDQAGLTRFTDIESVDAFRVGQSAIPAYDQNFKFPKGYFQVAERSLRLATLEFSNTESTIIASHRVDPVNLLIQKDFISTRLAAAGFIRYDLELTIRCLSTNFHYGQFMFVWRSAFAPYLNGLWSHEASGGRATLIKYQDAPSITIGPYDTIFTASQLKPTLMSITRGASVTIRIPWQLPFQYVPVRKMMYPQYHFGHLDVYKTTPIATSDQSIPRLEVFGSFKNIHGFVYNGNGLVCNEGLNTKPVHISYLTQAGAPSPLGPPVPTGKSDWDSEPTFSERAWINPWDSNYVLYDVVPAGSIVASNKLPTVEKPKRKSPLVSLNLTHSEHTRDRRSISDDSELEVVEAQADEYASQTSGSWLLDWTTGFIQAGLRIISPLGPILGAFGLSRPLPKEPPLRVMHGTLPFSQAVGPVPSTSTGVNQLSRVPRVNTDDDMLCQIDQLGAIPTYLGFVKFTTVKFVELSWSPTAIRPAKPLVPSYQTFAMSPSSFIVNKFRFWRGTPKITLSFFSSSFVDARFSVTLCYSESAGISEVGLNPTRIIEVKGETTVELEVPYMSPNLWRDRYEKEHMFVISVGLLTEPIGVERSKSPVIYMTAWGSVEGLQVSSFMPMLSSQDSDKAKIGDVIPMPLIGQATNNHTFPVALPEPRPPDKFQNFGFPHPNDFYHPYKLETKSQTCEVADAQCDEACTPIFVRISRIARRLSKAFKAMVPHNRQAECDSPVEVAAAQGEKMPLAGKLPTGGISVGMNDSPLSIYHMMKRYYATPFVSNLVPTWIQAAKLKRRTGVAELMCTTNNLPALDCAWLFRWIRTSYNILSNGDIYVVDNVSHNYSPPLLTGDTNAYTSAEMDWRAFAGPPTNANVSAVHVPFRSKQAFVPTPFLSQCKITGNRDFCPTAWRMDKIHSNSIHFSKTFSKSAPSHCFVACGDDLALRGWYGVPSMCYVSAPSRIDRFSDTTNPPSF